jgi:hypothetical protein
MKFHQKLWAAVFLVAASVAAQPVVVDGRFDPAEWTGAAVYTFTVNLPGGGTTAGELYLTNDASNLFAAVRYQQPALDPITNVTLEFDSPATDGVIGHQDDIVGVASSGTCSRVTTFGDAVRWQKRPCPRGTLCGFLDTDLGGAAHGNGAVGNDGTWTAIEMWHPLASGDALDMNVASGDKLWFTLNIALFGSSTAVTDTFYPGPGFGVLAAYLVR